MDAIVVVSPPQRLSGSFRRLILNFRGERKPSSTKLAALAVQAREYQNAGTIEDKVLEQKTKRDLADAIIGVGNSLIRDLTREDLERLLS